MLSSFAALAPMPPATTITMPDLLAPPPLPPLAPLPAVELKMLGGGFGAGAAAGAGMSVVGGGHGVQGRDEPRRKGKWTEAETAFASLVISQYRDGLLSLPVGVTVRSFLSGVLMCDAMRVTKKFGGANSIRKRVRYREAAVQSQHWTALVAASAERLDAQAAFWESVGEPLKASQASAQAAEERARLAPAPAPLLPEPYVLPRAPAQAQAPRPQPMHNAMAIAALLAPLPADDNTPPPPAVLSMAAPASPASPEPSCSSADEEEDSQPAKRVCV